MLLREVVPFETNLFTAIWGMVLVFASIMLVVNSYSGVLAFIALWPAILWMLGAGWAHLSQPLAFENVEWNADRETGYHDAGGWFHFEEYDTDERDVRFVRRTGPNEVSMGDPVRIRISALTDPRNCPPADAPSRSPAFPALALLLAYFVVRIVQLRRRCAIVYTVGVPIGEVTRGRRAA